MTELRTNRQLFTNLKTKLASFKENNNKCCFSVLLTSKHFCDSKNLEFVKFLYTLSKANATEQNEASEWFNLNKILGRKCASNG